MQKVSFCIINLLYLHFKKNLTIFTSGKSDSALHHLHHFFPQLIKNQVKVIRPKKAVVISRTRLRSKVFSLEKLWIKLLTLKDIGLVGLQYNKGKV